MEANKDGRGVTKPPQGSMRDIELTRAQIASMTKGASASTGKHNESNPVVPPGQKSNSPFTLGAGDGGGGIPISRWFHFGNGGGKKRLLLLVAFLIIILIAFVIATGGGMVQVKQSAGEYSVQTLAAPSPEVNAAMLSAKADLEASEIRLRAARADLEAAKLASKASETSKRINVTNTPPTLRTVDISTFDCTTHEKMNQGFATASTVDAEPGSQLIIRSGCANVRFNHKITSLRGSGYVVTFEPVNNSNIEACGNGASGKDDAPSTCIDYINKHIGETLHVVVSNNSFVKLGG